MHGHTSQLQTRERMCKTYPGDVRDELLLNAEPQCVQDIEGAELVRVAVRQATVEKAVQRTDQLRTLVACK